MSRDERDPMQRFYAKYGPMPHLMPGSLDDAEIFTLARQRAGSPLRVRAFASLTVLGMAIARMWPGREPDWAFYVVATIGLICIGSYYAYWSRSGGPLRVLHAWMLALPSRKDPGATRLEWVLAVLTLGLFLLTISSTLFFS